MKSPYLSDALHRLTHAYKRRLREGVREEQIPLPITHIRVLKGISRNAQATAQSIALRMQRDKAQITRALNDLLRAGLIVKEANPADRRSHLLRPSPSGEKLMARLQAVEQRTVEAMTHNLEPGELARFIQLATTMANNLGDAPPNTGDSEHG